MYSEERLFVVGAAEWRLERTMAIFDELDDYVRVRRTKYEKEWKTCLERRRNHWSDLYRTRPPRTDGDPTQL